jgi:hypothetical protein
MAQCRPSQRKRAQPRVAVLQRQMTEAKTERDGLKPAPTRACILFASERLAEGKLHRPSEQDKHGSKDLPLREKEPSRLRRGHCAPSAWQAMAYQSGATGSCLATGGGAPLLERWRAGKKGLAWGS